ncbi:glycosyl transferase [candidate division WWE3 bacterium CG_4_9_14_0_2_um_filter_35_11]|uniref:Glycosyl transferase n=1 Tax=candidate division WWE3 bacterium CG_4_9_14_0_2_um_filter_35_11 TaxID=1975077 RepID=A0A2M8ELR6_UNCKA|nr:MAG: glycosyl transferase [candidate division WWE3 bacterium CG10_big_fil_rev_8_21_14_0_10_35_32]PJC23684.1 MAG: glycosyl transferase [candidate division WWE3 bacterium CG_4_9_14_0_2_um_filter_35_11]
MSKKLSIVIPVYNEAGSVLKVLDSLKELPIEIEIIVVDDGSTDGTRTLLDKYSKSNKQIKVILMEQNGGKGTALREGFNHVTGDYTVVQDADFEYDPNDLITMFKFALDNNVDVVYGNRFSSKRFYTGMDWKNFLGNNIVLPTVASILYGQYIPDEATCYKMFRTNVLKSIPLVCKRFEFCPEVTAKVRKKGYRIYNIPIKYMPRTTNAGKKLNALKDGLEAISTLLRFRFFD